MDIEMGAMIDSVRKISLDMMPFLYFFWPTESCCNAYLPLKILVLDS